jgi:hypothetical protein
MLHAGQSVVVIAEKQPRRPDLVYAATCVLDDGEHIVLNAVRALPTVSIGPASFEPGDLFEEHYWRSRWYSVLKVVSAQGALKGWYGNVSSPAKVSSSAVRARDLELDLWVPANGSAPVRLDEEEFKASGLVANEPLIAEQAIRALAELETIVLTGGLQALLNEAPNPSIERTSPGKPGAASHVKR